MSGRVLRASFTLMDEFVLGKDPAVFSGVGTILPPSLHSHSFLKECLKTGTPSHCQILLKCAISLTKCVDINKYINAYIRTNIYK